MRSYAATTTTYSSSHYPFYDVQKPEPRDIIPRAVPSRPNSTYFGSSTVSTDITANSGAQRLFSTSSARPQSPPSPTTASSGNLWPFSRSVATSPSGSYSNADDHHSSTTAGAYPSTYHVGTTGYGYAYGYSGMDRPLPSRQGGAYSRPKSIELVTPMISR